MARRRPSQLLADGFASLTARASPRLRARVMASPARRPIARAIVAGMAREFDGGRAAGLDAIVRWEIGGRDRWDLVIADGRCRATRRAGREPDATIALDHVSFLELAAGIANAPQLFVTGRLRVSGDLMLAQRLTSLFRIPSPAAARADAPAGATKASRR